jgi:hypothetical protein
MDRSLGSKTRVCLIVPAAVFFLVIASGNGGMVFAYKEDAVCRYCGAVAHNSATLRAETCEYHPSGPYVGRHRPYHGHTVNKTLFCAHCQASGSIGYLTGHRCANSPTGHHVPARL